MIWTDEMEEAWQRYALLRETEGAYGDRPLPSREARFPPPNSTVRAMFFAALATPEQWHEYYEAKRADMKAWRERVHGQRMTFDNLEITL